MADPGRRWIGACGQQHHQQLVQVLESRFPETTASEPELVAHHCTEAGLVAEAIPFAALTEGLTERLYALKGEIVARGVRQVLGIEMSVFQKRRFQHGSVSPDVATRVFAQNELRYRQHFQALHTAQV